ncbi:MAG TPA: mycofactocin-associated electron transfer flavoprotein alpha subunit [Acidimicrobiales bacterium]|nr:mycofactocin-associated electron transfer flavoprotein alpha subunit [Acidimicrobiales bacterium]
MSGTGLGGQAIAIVVCRQGRLPAGAEEAVAEAGGRVLVVGTGADEVSGVAGATELWTADTSMGPGALGRSLAQLVGDVRLVLMPASADGRDLAPRLAADMGRPLLAGAVAVGLDPGGTVHAQLMRVDGRVVVPVSCDQPVVATLMPGVRSPGSIAPPSAPTSLDLPAVGDAHDAESLALVEPDPATMDLADARRVLGGGAGLVPAGFSDDDARLMFELLVEAARALGASAGATRVVTDAGWMPYDRQIGTTGVAIDPDAYVAFGISGASQHVGGLGAPKHGASVNVDASSPMTSMADLGIVADAPNVLVELAGRLGVPIPAALTSRLSVAKEPNSA